MGTQVSLKGYYNGIAAIAQLADNPRLGKRQAHGKLKAIFNAEKVPFIEDMFEKAYAEFKNVPLTRIIFSRS
jgi:hypothetical protein